MKILKHEDVLKRLVKKYNKGKWDEDLMQEAWLTAIKCEQANPDISENKLLGQMIIWVRNRLINIQTKKHLDTEPIPEGWDIPIDKDFNLLIFETKDSLNEQENRIFDMLLDGCTAKEICEKENLSKSTIYRIFDKIKGIMKS